jgi:hypothetical protein
MIAALLLALVSATVAQFPADYTFSASGMFKFDEGGRTFTGQLILEYIVNTDLQQLSENSTVVVTIPTGAVSQSIGSIVTTKGQAHTCVGLFSNPGVGNPSECFFICKNNFSCLGPGSCSACVFSNPLTVFKATNQVQIFAIFVLFLLSFVFSPVLVVVASYMLVLFLLSCKEIMPHCAGLITSWWP